MDTKVSQPNMGGTVNRDNFFSPNTNPENEQIGKSGGRKTAPEQ
jgi:hypothetical protein